MEATAVRRGGVARRGCVVLLLFVNKRVGRPARGPVT